MVLPFCHSGFLHFTLVLVVAPSPTKLERRFCRIMSSVYETTVAGETMFGMAYVLSVGEWGQHLIALLKSLFQYTDTEDKRVTFALEVFLTLSVGIFTAVTHRGEYSLAITAALLAGMLMSLAGTVLRGVIETITQVLKEKYYEEVNKGVTMELKSHSSIMLFVYFSSSLWYTVFTRVVDTTMACLCCALSGLALAVMAQLFTYHPVTRTAGLVLQERFFNPKKNWREAPVRSIIEMSMWVVGTSLAWWVKKDVLAAVQWGMFCGMMACFWNGSSKIQRPRSASYSQYQFRVLGRDGRKKEETMRLVAQLNPPAWVQQAFHYTCVGQFFYGLARFVIVLWKEIKSSAMELVCLPAGLIFGAVDTQIVPGIVSSEEQARTKFYRLVFGDRHPGTFFPQDTCRVPNPNDLRVEEDDSEEYFTLPDTVWG
jgi:hypothetical protein